MVENNTTTTIKISRKDHRWLDSRGARRDTFRVIISTLINEYKEYKTFYDKWHKSLGVKGDSFSNILAEYRNEYKEYKAFYDKWHKYINEAGNGGLKDIVEDDENGG